MNIIFPFKNKLKLIVNIRLKKIKTYKTFSRLPALPENLWIRINFFLRTKLAYKGICSGGKRGPPSENLEGGSREGDPGVAVPPDAVEVFKNF